MLRKRSIIETINDELKNICEVEHTPHHALQNFVMNLISALAAYCFFEKNRLSGLTWRNLQINALYFTNLHLFFVPLFLMN
jgi:hypothetical protein